MRLSNHCFALTGFAYVPPWSVNAGFVCGEERTLIVDSGPSAAAAETILGYARAARPTNRLLAIDTERHLDHIAGNQVFLSRGLEVWGHPTVRRTDADLALDLAEYQASIPDPARRAAGEGALPFRGTAIANPNVDVVEDRVLDLGGVGVEILLAPGHTSANLLVWVGSERVVYTGDTVVSDYQPNLASGGPAEWRAWLQALEKIETLRPALLVPGHGRVLRGEDEIRAEVARLRGFLLAALAGKGVG